jgi:hypothetical protein
MLSAVMQVLTVDDGAQAAPATLDVRPARI